MLMQKDPRPGHSADSVIKQIYGTFRSKMKTRDTGQTFGSTIPREKLMLWWNDSE